MVFHFDTRELAYNHLIANGWKRDLNAMLDEWISPDGSCIARIVALGYASKMVQVQVGELEVQ